MNRVITQSDLAHMGVKGMKWGVRRSNRKTESLYKNVRKMTKKYDRGKELPKDKVDDISKKVRNQKHRTEVRIKRAQRFLAKSSKADANQIINRFNRDPNKKAAVENYIKSLKINSETLSDLRLELIDIRS